jgi:hypothetical protein
VSNQRLHVSSVTLVAKCYVGESTRGCALFDTRPRDLYAFDNRSDQSGTIFVAVAVEKESKSRDLIGPGITAVSHFSPRRAQRRPFPREKCDFFFDRSRTSAFPIDHAKELTSLEYGVVRGEIVVADDCCEVPSFYEAAFDFTSGLRLTVGGGLAVSPASLDRMTVPRSRETSERVSPSSTQTVSRQFFSTSLTRSSRATRISGFLTCSNRLIGGVVVSIGWSWRTPCGARSAFHMTSALSRLPRDFPNRELPCTTANEHSSYVP